MMKKTILILLAISLLFIVLSCGGGGGGYQVGNTQVYIKASFLQSAALTISEISIVTIRYSITGSDMDPINGSVPVTGSVVDFVINVPNGPNRLFFIEALDDTGCLTGTWTSSDLTFISMDLTQTGMMLFTGSAVSDLVGTPVTLEITLTPVEPTALVAGNWQNNNTGCSYNGNGSYDFATDQIDLTFTTGMNPDDCCPSFSYSGVVNNCNSMSLDWNNKCDFSGNRNY
jgi:hypothetical protein